MSIINSKSVFEEKINRTIVIKKFYIELEIEKGEIGMPGPLLLSVIILSFFNDRNNAVFSSYRYDRRSEG